MNNRLTVLAADIRAAHQDVSCGALVVAERALAAGRMLIEAKAAVVHGEWATWLSEHVGMSARTARRYMQLTRSGVETATVADIGIRCAATKIARSRVPRPPLGYYTYGVFNDETQAIVYRCDLQPERFHVVVVGRIDGSDHAINATRHPVPDELLSICLAEAGFPIGGATFRIGASVDRVPEFLRSLAFDDEEVASVLSPELTSEAIARGISLSAAATILKHGLALEDGQLCLRLAAIPKDVFEGAIAAAKAAGIAPTEESVLAYAEARHS